MKPRMRPLLDADGKQWWICRSPNIWVMRPTAEAAYEEWEIRYWYVAQAAYWQAKQR